GGWEAGARGRGSAHPQRRGDRSTAGQRYGAQGACGCRWRRRSGSRPYRRREYVSTPVENEPARSPLVGSGLVHHGKSADWHRSYFRAGQSNVVIFGYSYVWWITGWNRLLV